MAVLTWGYAQDTPDGSENDKGQWTRTLKFIAVCDSLFDGPNVVLNYYLCPQRGDTYRFQGPDRYEYDSVCKVTDRKASRPDDNQPIWEVVISYKTPEDKDENEDPLDEPVEARGSGESYKEAAIGVANDSLAGPQFGDAIKNSAGEPFRPPPERENGYNVMQLVKNHPIDFDVFSLNDDYAFTVSSDQFFGMAAGRWMMFPVTWELKRKEPSKDLPLGRDYIRVTYTFKNKPKGWKLELLDIGSYYIPAAGPLTGKKVAFKGNDGQAYLGLLDGFGDKLNDGGNPVFLPPIKLYKEQAFAALNLPDSLEECKKFLR